MTSEKFLDSSHPQDNHRISERAIILKRPIFWSYIFASLVVGVGIGAGVWAAHARFDQTVAAKGNLEIQGAAKEIKTPTNGVIEKVHVRDGHEVEPDQPVAIFKATASKAEIDSLKKEKEALIRENQIHEDALRGGNLASEPNSPSLPHLRVELVNETRYYQALVTDENLKSDAGNELHANRQRLLAAATPELHSRASTARMKIQDLEKQQIQVKERLATTQRLLALNQDILKRLTQASSDVSVPQEQVQRQKQEVSNNQAAADKLKNEQQRIAKEIAQSKEELQNTLSLSTQDVLAKVSQNEQRIAQIDSQLKQALLENQKQIAAIDAKLSKLVQPQTQPLKAPIEGVVFAVQQQPTPGFATRANQALLTVLPKDSAVASVFLPSQEIGHIKKGMDVEVKVASFPKNELGTVKGELTWVGSQVVPPAPGRPYHAVPARIQLERPYLEVKGNRVRLQSGMPVGCEIVVPDKLTVWDILRDKWQEKTKTVKTLMG